MKRISIVLALLALGAFVAQPALAADIKAPRKQAKRHYAPKPHKHAHKHKHHHDWICNKSGECTPKWGWGMQTPSGPVAAVIVARGDLPIWESDRELYKRECGPRTLWNGYRWVKQWDRC